MQQRYHTKQRETVLACLSEHRNQSLSAKDIYRQCQEANENVGLTTVYRQAEMLVAEGKAKKVVTGEGKTMHYQFVADRAGVANFFMKCDRCGKIEPIDCHHLTAIVFHMKAEHGFAINREKSIFYGCCRGCAD